MYYKSLTFFLTACILKVIHYFLCNYYYYFYFHKKNIRLIFKLQYKIQNTNLKNKIQ